ncbi:MAG: alpha-amylase family glycosyl hydrolase, partial [Pseudomonadota bacterium]|nr:alpha-amylase family glycosyl hydrolase [Pseudomonadota bacterium]
MTQAALDQFTQRVTEIYGDAQNNQQIAREILTICQCFADKTSRSVLEVPTATGHKRWSEEDVILITYGNSVQTADEMPLKTLSDFLKERLADVINSVHILPFFPYSSDDGFSVIDYRQVHPDWGTWEDVASIADNFDLMIDLVINHCSRENLWFIDYIGNREPYTDYFIEVDPATDVSLVTRPRNTPLLTPVHTHRGIRHVWATFSEDQIDLNFANPEVLFEFVKIYLFYIEQGARFIRLDAVAF